MSETSKSTVPHVDSTTFKARLWPSVRQATPLAFAWAVTLTALRAPIFLLLGPQEATPIGLPPAGALLVTFGMSYVLAIAVLATRAATYPEGTYAPTAGGVINLAQENWRPTAIAFAIAVPLNAVVWFVGMKTLHEAAIFFIGNVELLVAMMLASVQPATKEGANSDRAVAAND